MKIIHIVTLFTPDGAFGGPTRVAINQTRELRDRGHDVTLAGASLGYGKVLPTEIDGVPVKLFPARRVIPRSGFAGLTSPGLLAWFRRASADADLVHIHLARDLVTMPSATWASANKVPYVLQTHGMIDAPSNVLAKLLDRLATRTVLRNAKVVLCLTEAEEPDIAGVSQSQATTAVLPNGVPHCAQEPENAGVDVLFLARLHARKRPVKFVDSALELHTDFPNVRFSLVGPDEGEISGIARTLSAHGSPAQIQWEGPLNPGLTVDRMKRAHIYVLPAINEPFGMTVVEAMSVGKPVIVTDTCALANLVHSSDSGLVVDESTESLTTAIRTLLTDPKLRATMGANALKAARTYLGMNTVTDRLEAIYAAADAG